MDSTEAIRAAIEIVQAQLQRRPTPHSRSKAYGEEVIAQLQRLPQASGSNYGTLWSIDDLRERRPAWSDEKLTAWMEDNWRNISDRQCEEGWETIGTLLEIDGMCEGCGEDSSDDVCPKCEDDYAITVCIKCDHVMRREHLDDDICNQGCG